MSERGITIVLRAKNAMQRGLGQAGKALQNFGKSALRIGKQMAVGMLAAGTAIAGMAVKALAAWSKQESAERSLIAARRAAGDAMADNIDTHKAMAAAIQDATGVADEQTLATMAQLRTLGVLDSQLGQAAKGMIALTGAGMGGATAQRAMAAAMAGNFEMLTRYIPALRDAKDEAEKMAIVNDFLNRGYQAQQERLNTTAGQWQLLKGRVGDAWEEIGKAVAQNGALIGTLQRAGDAVKAFGERVQQWAGSGGVDRLMQGVRMFGAESVLVYDKLVAYVAYAMAESYESVTWFGRATVQTMKNAGKITENIWRNTTDAVGHWLAKMHAKASGQEWNINPPDLRDILDGVEAIPKKTGAAMNALTADLEAINAKHAARMGEIAGGRADGVEAAAQREIEANDNIIGAGAAAMQEREKLADQQKKLIDELRNAQQEAAREEVDAAKKAADEKRKIAEMTVQDFIDAAKAQKDAEKDAAREARRMQQLEEREARGTKLSRRDQQRLDAFRQIEAAKAGAGADAADVKRAQDRLEELQGRQLRAVEAVKTELEANHRRLNQLLAMG